MNYRAEWHPGDGATFLGTERFVKKISKETIPPPISRRISLKDLLKRVGPTSGVPAEILVRKGRLANLVQTRDRSSAKLYWNRATSLRRWRNFLLVIRQCHSGAAEELIDLGKSVTAAMVIAAMSRVARQKEGRCGTD